MKIGWHKISADEARELQLPQFSRIKYEAFSIEIFGVGITVSVRPTAENHDEQ